MCYSVLFFKHPIAPKNLCGFFKRAKVIIFFKSTKSRMSYFTVFYLIPGMMLQDGLVPGAGVNVGIDFGGEDALVPQHFLDDP